MELIGQILGFIAIIIAFVVYQMKSRKSLLVAQTALVLVMSVHYFCLAAYPAMAMNLFGIARNFIYYRKDIFRWKYTPLMLAVMAMSIGIVASSGVWSILVIAGLTINTYCLSFKNPQHLRYSILLSSPLVLLYNIVIFSLGGIMLESISIISAVIGILRYAKPNK